MLKTIIIDDEQLARRRMRKMLSTFQDVEILDEAENGSDAIAKIEHHNPDLLFLDVLMPDINGFEVLKMMEVTQQPYVIFVTAFDQYAVDAFEANAIDYLLKPVSRERLETAVEKARQKLQTPQREIQIPEGLLDLAQNSKSYVQRLPVRSQNRILVLNIDQVVALRIDRGLVYVNSAEGEYWTKYTTFSKLENLLDPKNFLRVHRQTMVNLNHIREINVFDNNTARVTLSNGQQVDVSRNYLKSLRQVLNW
ncbi:MAG TPA: response regulator [Blastocatellia bacterium]|nr:response regulator [Blastocatellia bacterium]